jgi:hypothetical protein
VKLSAAAAATAAVAFAVGGCGGGDGSGRRQAAAPRVAPTPAPAPVVVTFKRFRLAGATEQVLRVHTDGRFEIDVPSGGAGRAQGAGRLRVARLRAVRRLVRRIDWSDLSPRKAVYDLSGAYFMVRHAGREHVAMASGMSRDLLPLVRRLDDVLNGGGRAAYRTVQRYYTHS